MEALLVGAEAELLVVAAFVDQDGVAGVEEFDVGAQQRLIDLWEYAHGIPLQLAEHAAQMANMDAIVLQFAKFLNE